MESFDQFRPLFFDALNQGSIGLCQWFESGTTIETAIPEIYSLTKDKENWKAIIIRLDDDDEMREFETVPDNPYDFVANLSSDISMHESNIPLIRLTHMLGGLPSPNVHFKAELIHEANKVPRTVYTPSVSEEDLKAHSELSEKYHFYGQPPSEIILVSLTKSQNLRVEQVKKAWNQRNEIESSEFWKRNGYPSMCRFTYYEMKRQGSVQNTADLFTAWSAVMLLATNNIDPSTLQAYKLNRLNVLFDPQRMRDCFQNTIDRTVSAKEFIIRSLQRELEQRINEKPALPLYRLNAPVDVDLPLIKDYYVKESVFGLASRTTTSDLEQWNTMRKTAHDAVSSAQKTAERALDRTADRMRKYSLYSPEEIVPLDAYQMEDMDGELSELHKRVFDKRTELRGFRSEESEKIGQTERRVFDKLITRLTKRQSSVLIALFLGLLLLSSIPQIWYYSCQGFDKLGYGLVEILAGFVAVCAVFLALLLHDRNELRSRIADFNSCTGNAITRIGVSAEQYSDYMSSIASFIHGSSYLNCLQRKHIMNDEDDSFKRNHIAALNAFLESMKAWATAFHLSVYFDSADIREEIDLNTDLAPGINPLYTFDEIESFPVEVNNTGSIIESPVSFIKELIIQREELFDDAK